MPYQHAAHPISAVARVSLAGEPSFGRFSLRLLGQGYFGGGAPKPLLAQAAASLSLRASSAGTQRWAWLGPGWRITASSLTLVTDTARCRWRVGASAPWMKFALALLQGSERLRHTMPQLVSRINQAGAELANLSTRIRDKVRTPI